MTDGFGAFLPKNVICCCTLINKKVKKIRRHKNWIAEEGAVAAAAVKVAAEPSVGNIEMADEVTEAAEEVAEVRSY